MKDHTAPEGTYVRVHHLHSGNSTKRERKNFKYVTVAKLHSDDDRSVLCSAMACCGKNDIPNRATGRNIAIGRVIKKYHEEYSENVNE